MEDVNVDVNEAAGAAEAVSQPEAGEERYVLLDAGHIALVQDKTTGEVIGAQLLFGGVVRTRLAAMHTLDLIDGAMRMTGWRIDQVARVQEDAPASVQ